MSTTLSRPAVIPISRLRVAHGLTVLIIPLAAIAAAGGLAIPNLYRNPATIIPALQGQDLITLLMLLPLTLALLGSTRGSARATLVWLGLLGYVWYTYTGAAFAYYFNGFYLLYIALFSLSSFALAAAVAGIDAAAFAERCDLGFPRRPAAVFLCLIALMLGVLEFGQNLQFILTGEIPAGVVAAGNTSYFVYVIDLGLVVPLCLLAAAWLWQRQSWGVILAEVMLVKAAAMGLALLAMDWFIVMAGRASDGLEAIWAVIGAGGLSIAFWMLSHLVSPTR